MLQNRPIVLVLLAAALIYAGLDAIYATVGLWSSGRLGLNFAFLLVPAGIGLLRLSEGWRRFTLYTLMLAVIGLFGFLGYEIVRPGQMAVSWFGTRVEGVFRYVIFGALLGCGSLVVSWAFHTLTRPEIKHLFEVNAEPQSDTIHLG